MIAEILSTGDEVLLGDIVDTNSAWLCRELTELGLRPEAISAVGDDAGRICAVIKTISQRADLCIVTGGLGPTQDDITAAACARAAGTQLAKDANAFASMTRFFDQKGWQMTPENEKQSLLPEGATFLENLNGTAPGFDIRIRRCRFFFLPGVPGEMKEMFRRQVCPRLIEATGNRDTLLIRRLTVFGLPESEVGRRLADFTDQYPDIRLGFRARFPLIEVKLVDTVADPEDGEAGKKNDPGTKGTEAGKRIGVDAQRQRGRMEDALAWAAQRLGRRVVSFEGLSLAQEVGRLLSSAGQTLSVAESCTGGLISNMITDVPGASDYFLFTAVTYANSAKINILGVLEETLASVGAVHEDTAGQMASGARKVGGSDWAVSTTGIAGPSGGTAEKPVGTVCIGVAGSNGTQARRFVLDTGDREKNKQLFAAAALEMLRRALSEKVAP